MEDAGAWVLAFEVVHLAWAGLYIVYIYLCFFFFNFIESHHQKCEDFRHVNICRVWRISKCKSTPAYIPHPASWSRYDLACSPWKDSWIVWTMQETTALRERHLYGEGKSNKHFGVSKKYECIK